MERYRRLDAVRLQLDDGITRLVDKLREFRNKRNAVSPIISVLTLEILEDIFLTAVCLSEKAKAGHGPKTCVRLTHVCQQWRNIGIGCQRLWSKIQTMTPEMTQRWLKRVHSIPLDLSLDDSYAWMRDHERLLPILLPKIPRSRILTLRLLETTPDKILASFQQEAPLLESLDLGVAKGRGVSTWAQAQRLAIPGIFSGFAPRLRSLRLSGLSIDWTSSILTGLTSLCLYDIRRSSRLSVPQARAILDRCPDLHTLVLVGALKTTATLTRDTSFLSPLRLSSLASFEISSEEAQIMALLNRIRLPSTASLRLSFDNNLDKSEFRALMKLLEFSRRNETHVPAFRNLDFELTGPVFKLTLSSVNSGLSPQQVSSPVPSPPPHEEGQTFEILFSQPLVPGAAVERFTMLLESFNLTKVDTLRFGGKSRVMCTDHTWSVMFRACPNVKYLDIAGLSVGSLIAALSREPPAQGSAASRLPRLPKMHCLTIRDVNFMDNASFGGMRSCFEDRRERGHPIKRLEVINCWNLSYQDMAELEYVVDRVEWDGIGCVDDEDGDEEESDEDCEGGSDCDCPDCLREDSEYEGVWY